MPGQPRGPLWRMSRRLSYAFGAILVMATTVYLDRDGYRDNADDEVSLLDAVYYASVSLSTTGYGDITPVSVSARTVNVLVILPLRLFFLALLVGTTFEVLGTRTREQWRLNRWRSRLHGHTVVVGYGTKGRSAVSVLLSNGTARSAIVVIDSRPAGVKEASGDGLVAVVGDSTRSIVLREAGVDRAARVIVAVDRDDAAILTTLTTRQLNPTVPISVAVREAENAPLARHSGADSVVTSSEAAGRLLAHSPAVGQVLDDLLNQGKGLDVVERPARADELGRKPAELPGLVLGVMRAGTFLRYAAAGEVRAGDRLVTIQGGEPGD